MGKCSLIIRLILLALALLAQTSASGLKDYFVRANISHPVDRNFTESILSKLADLYQTTFNHQVNFTSIQTSLSNTVVVFVCSDYDVTKVISLMCAILGSEAKRLSVTSDCCDVSSLKMYSSYGNAVADIKAYKFCDIGMYPEGDHCVPCGTGKTTLLSGSNSHLDCVDECSAGQVYSLQSLNCLPCPEGSYRSEFDQMCYMCLYNEFDSVYCKGAHPVTNNRINIEMDINLVTHYCLLQSGYSLTEAYDATLQLFVPSVFRIDQFQCFWAHCWNWYASLRPEDLCIPDPSCTDMLSCELFRIKVRFGFYHVWTYSDVYAGFSYINTLDMFLKQIAYFNSNSFSYPQWKYFPNRIELPFQPNVTVIDSRMVFSKWLALFMVSGQLMSRNPLRQVWVKVADFLGILRLLIRKSKLPLSGHNSSVWFNKDIDDELLYRFVVAQLTSDTNKKYGNVIMTFYRDIHHKLPVFNICELANKLRVSFIFCDTGEICNRTNNWDQFICIEDQECSDWTWGENCDKPCNCSTKGTSKCGKTYGTCICKSGVHPTLNCEQDVNECATEGICGPSFFCNNTEGGYECISCDWRYGVGCTEECLCNKNNTQSCDWSGNCQCKENYSGAFCEEMIDACYGRCQGDHGYCISNNADYTCHCDIGYAYNNTSDVHTCEENMIKINTSKTSPECYKENLFKQFVVTCHYITFATK
ncbi:hypothetical protein Btru_045537 [Bulinus truncatus]|nr:hypothetical protein Btru_045537 [Bulinus truncatus]